MIAGFGFRKAVGMACSNSVVDEPPQAIPIVRVSWYRILVKIRGYFDMRHTFEDSGF
jgi:hypothetical protein